MLEQVNGVSTLKRCFFIHNHQRKHSHSIRKKHLGSQSRSSGFAELSFKTKTGGAAAQQPRPQRTAPLTEAMQSGTRSLCLSRMPAERLLKPGLTLG